MSSDSTSSGPAILSVSKNFSNIGIGYGLTFVYSVSYALINVITRFASEVVSKKPVEDLIRSVTALFTMTLICMVMGKGNDIRKLYRSFIWGIQQKDLTWKTLKKIFWNDDSDNGRLRNDKSDDESENNIIQRAMRSLLGRDQNSVLNNALIFRKSHLNRISSEQDFKNSLLVLLIGLSDVIFLIGYTETLAYLSTTEYAALSVAGTPIVGVLLGFLTINEEINESKMIGLIRNAVVVILVIDPVGFFSNGVDGGTGFELAGYSAGIELTNDISGDISDVNFTTGSTFTGISSDPTTSLAANPNHLFGFLYGFMTCLGCVFMRILQRKVVAINSAVMAFYCFFVVTLLCSIPGVIGCYELSDSDYNDSPLLRGLFCCSLSGAIACLMVAGQGVILKYLDCGTFSVLMAPMALLLSFLTDCFLKDSVVNDRVVTGIWLAIFGIVAEWVTDKGD